MHAVCGIRGADIDMDQDTLAAPGDERVTAGHVGGSILMRATHDARHRIAAFLPVRHLIDDRGVIGSKITKQIIDADLFQTFEQIIGRGEIGNIGLLGCLARD